MDVSVMWNNWTIVDGLVNIAVYLENVLVISYKIKQISTLWTSKFIIRYLPKINESIYPKVTWKTTFMLALFVKP